MLILVPVFKFDSFYSFKFTSVMSDNCKTLCNGMSSNQSIHITYRSSFFSKISIDDSILLSC